MEFGADISNEELGIDETAITNDAIVMGDSMNVVQHIENMRRELLQRRQRQQQITDALFNMNIQTRPLDSRPYFVK